MCRIAHVPYRWLKVRAMLPAISWPSLSATQHPFLPRACRRCTVRTHPREYKQVAYSQKLDAQPPEMTSNLEQVLFVESGFGCDQHGQNATVRLFEQCPALALYLCRFDLEWPWQTSEGVCTSVPERH
ncbi:hypothetical protein ABBQ38_006789 [Trebouxia sp. C0009 RCD-2024]